MVILVLVEVTPEGGVNIDGEAMATLMLNLIWTGLSALISETAAELAGEIETAAAGTGSQPTYLTSTCGDL